MTDMCLYFAEFIEGYYRVLYLDSNLVIPTNLGDLKRGIYHFVGSQKPWDLFGSFIHRSYHIWGDLIGGSAFSEFRFIIKFWREHLRRAFIIRRSYARVLLARIKSK